MQFKRRNIEHISLGNLSFLASFSIAAPYQTFGQPGGIRSDSQRFVVVSISSILCLSSLTGHRQSKVDLQVSLS